MVRKGGNRRENGERRIETKGKEGKIVREGGNRRENSERGRETKGK